MEEVSPKFVVPGDLLGPSLGYVTGVGTYKRGGSIYASTFGHVKLKGKSINVERDGISTATRTVPKQGCVVLCRVISVSQGVAKVLILSVDGCTLKDPLRGIIRREEIRATEKDTVEVFNSFRPRDFIRARVIGLGENQAYVLSTAENELGVVLAKTSDNEDMTPVSWCEVCCPATGGREKRKVAKVIDSVTSGD